MNRRDFGALLLASSAAAGCDLFERQEAAAARRTHLGARPRPPPRAGPGRSPISPVDAAAAGRQPGLAGARRHTPTHAMDHLGLADQAARAWETSIGDGSSRYTQGVVAAGRRAAAGSSRWMAASRSARSMPRTGSRIWQVDLKPERTARQRLRRRPVPSGTTGSTSRPAMPRCWRSIRPTAR